MSVSLPRELNRTYDGDNEEQEREHAPVRVSACMRPHRDPGRNAGAENGF